MTEDEGAFLHGLREEFYTEYSKLVAKFVMQAPFNLRAELLDQLQDMSNVFSCNYDQHTDFRLFGVWPCVAEERKDYYYVVADRAFKPTKLIGTYDDYNLAVQAAKVANEQMFKGNKT